MFVSICMYICMYVRVWDEPVQLSQFSPKKDPSRILVQLSQFPWKSVPFPVSWFPMGVRPLVGLPTNERPFHGRTFLPWNGPVCSFRDFDGKWYLFGKLPKKVPFWEASQTGTCLGSFPNRSLFGKLPKQVPILEASPNRSLFWKLPKIGTWKAPFLGEAFEAFESFEAFEGWP